MKILNIFKKNASISVTSKKATGQKIDKKQLEKVIGGGGSDVIDGEVQGPISTSRSNIRHS